MLSMSWHCTSQVCTFQLIYQPSTTSVLLGYRADPAISVADVLVSAALVYCQGKSPLRCKKPNEHFRAGPAISVAADVLLSAALVCRQRTVAAERREAHASVVLQSFTGPVFLMWSYQHLSHIEVIFTPVRSHSLVSKSKRCQTT